MDHSANLARAKRPCLSMLDKTQVKPPFLICKGHVFSNVHEGTTIYTKDELDAAYKEGRNDGCDHVYADGQIDGYDECRENAYSQGQSDGYNEGHEDGYAAGYEDGLADCQVAEYDDNGENNTGGTDHICGEDCSGDCTFGEGEMNLLQPERDFSTNYEISGYPDADTEADDDIYSQYSGSGEAGDVRIWRGDDM